MARRKPPDLKRRPAKREPKRRFVIFCEGAKTEPAYFNALRQYCSSALIEVKPLAAQGVPDTLTKNAVAEAKSLRRKGADSFEQLDEIWAVFDRDEHPKFDEAVQRCESNRVRVGRSNPCFELWLILHHEDYDKPDGRHAVQAHCERVCEGYDKHSSKTPDCSGLLAHVEAAIKRAEDQLARRKNEDNEFGCPSTTIGSLVQAILESAARYRRG